LKPILLLSALILAVLLALSLPITMIPGLIVASIGEWLIYDFDFKKFHESTKKDNLEKFRK